MKLWLGLCAALHLAGCSGTDGAVITTADLGTAASTDSSCTDAACAAPDLARVCVSNPFQNVCSDDPTSEALAGRCNADGTCTCVGDVQPNPQTGKCLPPSGCPKTDSINGSSCTVPNQQCAYLPMTMCTCIVGTVNNVWSCIY